MYKEVIGDLDMKDASFIGIYTCLKYILFIFFVGLLFSWAYFCCEHIGIFYGLVATHLNTALSLFGCLFIYLAIKFEEHSNHNFKKYGRIPTYYWFDYVIGGCIVSF